jgi:hypothetical protein
LGFFLCFSSSALIAGVLRKVEPAGMLIAIASPLHQPYHTRKSSHLKIPALICAVCIARIAQFVSH